MCKTLVFATRSGKGEAIWPCTKDEAKRFAGGKRIERVAKLQDGTRIAVLGAGRAVYMHYMTREQMRHWGI